MGRRTGPLTPEERLQRRVRAYLRKLGAEIITVGLWDRVDCAFMGIVTHSEEEHAAVLRLLAHERSFLDVTEDTGREVYVALNRDKVRAIQPQ